ncbi:hypothetical protein E2C01_022927 [Portunus trituberculatus]|uniref:Uncharacterized protein n=1 Tax=Portunus trituberculatus TaxID=210409 RepID=A0A5B7E6P4_PORTR|nr:hypothetical protein [Portunus trituberculatus]
MGVDRLSAPPLHPHPYKVILHAAIQLRHGDRVPYSCGGSLNATTGPSDAQNRSYSRYPPPPPAAAPTSAPPPLTAEEET